MDIVGVLPFSSHRIGSNKRFEDALSVKYLRDAKLHSAFDIAKEVEPDLFKPDSYSIKASKLNMCPNSQIVRKYIPHMNKTVELVVPCGKCAFCSHRKQNALIFRAWNHNRYYMHSLFVTLTYNDEHYIDNPDVCKDDIQKFFKRLRRYIVDDYGCEQVTYLVTCERGTLHGRLHFHFLLWWNGSVSYSRVKSAIRKAWRFPARDLLQSSFCPEKKSQVGFIYFGQVTNKSITYCTKYSIKDLGNNCIFIHWSKGLGAQVLNNDEVYDRFRFFHLYHYTPNPTDNPDGYTIPVPTYYKNKIFNMVELALIFENYLTSLAAKEKLKALRDDGVMAHYKALYTSYLYKTMQKRKSQEINKKRKKRLL